MPKGGHCCRVTFRWDPKSLNLLWRVHFRQSVSLLQTDPSCTWRRTPKLQQCRLTVQRTLPKGRSLYYYLETEPNCDKNRFKKNFFGLFQHLSKRCRFKAEHSCLRCGIRSGQGFERRYYSWIDRPWEASLKSGERAEHLRDALTSSAVGQKDKILLGIVSLNPKGYHLPRYEDELRRV